MHYIKDIRNPNFKIGLYKWNGKYIIKIEAGGMYEQIYKVDETDIATVEEIDALLDEVFMQSISERFKIMHADLVGSMERNGLLF